MAEKKLKQLPLGISAFSEIVQGDYVYVDKTQYIHKMVTEGKYYFLSRPRRFGKSLLISTLGELFSGNKELFNGLWIANSDYNWQEHPVIRFDFANIAHRTTHDLVLSITSRLEELAQQYTVDISNMPTVEDKFSSLIKKLSQQNKVVILIDEYDKPILDHINKTDEAEAQREVLRSFYSIIKGSDQYLRFVMLTGVTKFAKTSIFSGLNNLRDITLNDQIATFLGYTSEEIEIYFDDHVKELAKKLDLDEKDAYSKLCERYDGYHFAANVQAVYNPYSVLNCLADKSFDDYWFETGTPTFLISLLKKSNYDLTSITSPVLSKNALGSFEITDIPFVTLLYQTGYLTIKSYDPVVNRYTLGIPNREVHNALMEELANAFTGLPIDKTPTYAEKLANALKLQHIEKFQQELQNLFNEMPYTRHIEEERDLHFVVYSMCKLIGIAIDPEVTTSIGRADLVVDFPKLIYVIELKFNKTEQEALEQIQDRKYYEKYLNAGKQITLLGINFDKPTKTVSVVSQDIS